MIVDLSLAQAYIPCCLNIVDADNLDVVMLDVCMSHMDGQPTARSLEQQRQEVAQHQ